MQKKAFTLHDSHFKREIKKKKKDIPVLMKVYPCNSLWKKVKRGCPSLIQQADKLEVKSLFFIIFIVRLAPKDTQAEKLGNA